MRKSFLIWGLIILLLSIFHPPRNSAQVFGREPLRECWRLKGEILRNANYASDNVSILYIPLSGGIIKAFDTTTDRIVWQSEIGGEIAGSVLLDDDQLYVSALDNSAAEIKKLSIASLSSSTGITRWKKEFKAQPETASVYTLRRNGVLYTVSNRGQIFLLNKTTGDLISEDFLDLYITCPPILGNREIYLGNSDNRILGFSTSPSGSSYEELIKLKSTPTAMLSTDSNSLFVGDKLGTVSRVNIRDKKLSWESRAGAEITDITEIGDKLLVSSSDNYVYLLSKKNGNRIWKKRLDGKNQGASTFSNGVAVFSPMGEQTATFVELKNGKTVNHVALKENKENEENEENVENFFLSSPRIVGGTVIFSTLQGFYGFAAEGCRRQANAEQDKSGVK